MVLKKEYLEKGIFFGGTTRLLLKKYSHAVVAVFPLTNNFRMEENRPVSMMLSRHVKLCSPTSNVQA